jgi:hypothetical protein
MYVLFPLLVHAYNFLNPFVVVSTSINSKMNNFGARSLYDLMKLAKKWLYQWSKNNHAILELKR